MTCCYSSSRSVRPSETVCGMRSHFIENGKRSCHFLATSCGTDNNKPQLLLFFVHGVGSKSALWIPYISNMISTHVSLKNTYSFRFVAPDIFGHGNSSASGNRADYTFSKLCGDLIALFDKEMESCKSVVLIGHSYGCSIVSFIAAARLPKVIGLCLISPPAPVPLEPKDSIIKFPTSCMCLLFPCLQMTFRRQAYSAPICCATADEQIAFNIKPQVFHNVMLGQVWPGCDQQFFASLSKCRSLVIHGENDRLVPPVEAEMTSKILGAQFFLVKNAGHMVPLEAVNVVNEILTTFLNAIP